jgi:MFS superfamily sulfate permease-like transporter
MEGAEFKKIVDKEMKAFNGIKIGKKYVWDSPELLIFIDIQRSEFKNMAFFINVSYFVKVLSSEVLKSDNEYLGDVVYRFNSGVDELQYNDVFVIEDSEIQINLHEVLKRELRKFIEDIRTVDGLKAFVNKYSLSRPFVKASVEKFFLEKDNPPALKQGIFSRLLRSVKKI